MYNRGVEKNKQIPLHDIIAAGLGSLVVVTVLYLALKDVDEGLVPPSAPSVSSAPSEETGLQFANQPPPNKMETESQKTQNRISVNYRQKDNTTNVSAVSPTNSNVTAGFDLIRTQYDKYKIRLRNSQTSTEFSPYTGFDEGILYLGFDDNPKDGFEPQSFFEIAVQVKNPKDPINEPLERHNFIFQGFDNPYTTVALYTQGRIKSIKFRGADKDSLVVFDEYYLKNISWKETLEIVNLAYFMNDIYKGQPLPTPTHPR